MMKYIIFILFLLFSTQVYSQYRESVGIGSVNNPRVSREVENDSYYMVRTNQTGIIVWRTLTPSKADIFNLDEASYILLGYTTLKNNRITSNPSDYDYWLIKKNTSIFNTALYPNPALNKVTIFIDKLIGNLQISVFNTQGVLVYNTEISDFYTIINLDNLENGIYFIKLHTNIELIKTYKLCVLQNHSY